MKLKLESKEVMVDGEEITIWTITNTAKNTHVVINQRYDSISDCIWIDKNHRFIEVCYSDWNDNEVVAIMDYTGAVIRDEIYCIEDMIEKPYLFIVCMSGAAMGNASYYGIDIDDRKYGVIDQLGEFIIDPEFDFIEFDKTNHTFCATNGSRSETFFDLNGNRIEIKEEDEEDNDTLLPDPIGIYPFELFADLNTVQMN